MLLAARVVYLTFTEHALHSSYQFSFGFIVQILTLHLHVTMLDTIDLLLDLFDS